MSASFQFSPFEILSTACSQCSHVPLSLIRNMNQKAFYWCPIHDFENLCSTFVPTFQTQICKLEMSENCWKDFDMWITKSFSTAYLHIFKGILTLISCQVSGVLLYQLFRRGEGLEWFICVPVIRFTIPTEKEEGTLLVTVNIAMLYLKPALKPPGRSPLHLSPPLLSFPRPTSGSTWFLASATTMIPVPHSALFRVSLGVFGENSVACVLHGNWILFFIQQLDLFGFILISTLKIKSSKLSPSLGLAKFKLSLLNPSSKSHPCTLYWTMSQALLWFESL